MQAWLLEQSYPPYPSAHTHFPPTQEPWPEQLPEQGMLLHTAEVKYLRHGVHMAWGSPGQLPEISSSCTRVHTHGQGSARHAWSGIINNRTSIAGPAPGVMSHTARMVMLHDPHPDGHCSDGGVYVAPNDVYVSPISDSVKPGRHQVLIAQRYHCL